MLKKYLTTLKKNWFRIAVFFIFILATVIRFYNYDQRWGLAPDQAREAIIGRTALSLGRLPIIGAFYSAGPFTWGPWFYWFIALATAVYPRSIITPWIILTITSIISVLIFIRIGKILGGNVLGITLGLLATFSTAELASSANLTNPSMISFLAVLSILLFIEYLINKRSLCAFLLGLIIGIALNIHLQSIGLLTLVPLMFIFTSTHKTNQNLLTWLRAILREISIKALLFLVLGLLLPFIPLIIFDLNHNWINLRNILIYYLFEQGLVGSSNSWFTYLGIFWPKFWAQVTGGYPFLGYCLAGLTILVYAWLFFKRKLPRILFILSISFFLQVIMLRYHHGPKFYSYLSFLQPFVLIFTGWALFQLSKISRLIGTAVLILVIFGSFRYDIYEYRNKNHAPIIQSIKSALVDKFPNEKFAIYDEGFSVQNYSFPLSLFLQVDKKTSEDGIPIGVCAGSCPSYKPIIQKSPPMIVDLREMSQEQLETEKWFLVTPNSLYHSTVEWWK